MSRRKPKNVAKTESSGAAKTEPSIIVAVIGLFGVIILATLSYLGGPTAAKRLEIETTQTKETFLTAIHLTSNAVNIQSTDIIQKLTETPNSNMSMGSEVILQKTATEIANQAISIKSTQTAMALAPFFIQGMINPDFPSPSINVRSSAELPDDNSNIVGSVKPGDKIIVTGWTEAQWIWYQIDVPSKNITDAWISGIILINDIIYESVILDENISELPESLFIRTNRQNMP